MAAKSAPAPVPAASEPLPAVALLAAAIKSSLASTEGIYKVAVHHLWDDRFRVNVLMGADAVTSKVGQSYFIVADAQGNVVSSIPQLRTRL